VYSGEYDLFPVACLEWHGRVNLEKIGVAGNSAFEGNDWI